jgi:hypothetical protein
MNKHNEQTLIEKAQDQGIYLNSYSEGDYRVQCPECSCQLEERKMSHVYQ